MNREAEILEALNRLYCGLVPHRGGRPITEWHRWDTHKKFTKSGIVDSGDVPVDDMGRPLFAGCLVTLERESSSITKSDTLVQKGGDGDNMEFGAILRITAGSTHGSMSGFRRVVLGPHAPVFLRIGDYQHFNIEATFVGLDLDEKRFDISCKWLRRMPENPPALFSPWRKLDANNVPTHTHTVPAGSVALINGVTPVSLTWVDAVSLETGSVVSTLTSLAPHETLPVQARGTHVVEANTQDAFIKWELSNF